MALLATASAAIPSIQERDRAPLPLDHLEYLHGFGRSVGAAGYVFRPSTTEGLRGVLLNAHRRRLPVVLRGSGRSYGDASLRPEAMVLHLGRMNRILAWDPQTGILDAEPGVTIRDVWRYTLGDGWWPSVVPGTMFPTLAGCLAMNVHGKNNWARGTVGDHCLEMDLLLPDGEALTVSRHHRSDLFHAVIGGFGQLGIITRLQWQLKRVHSGLVEVKAISTPNLEAMLHEMDEAKDDYEYVVGWIDAFAKGKRLGRGQLHLARYLEPEEDPNPAQSLRLGAQDLPDTFFGLLPRSTMWRFMKPWTNRPGMRIVNGVKYRLSSTLQEGAVYRQSLAGYQFLLDYVPGWERAYLPGGLIQHQSFVPKEAAAGVFRKMFETCRRRRMPAFLAVLKRHRPDPFLLSHAVDGYSLALDFPVTTGNRERLWALVRELAEPVVEAGGRFYAAKDAALPAETFQATFKEGQLDRFAELRAEIDPQSSLTSALAERLLAPLD